MPFVTKFIFLEYRQCRTRGWFLRNLDRTAPLSAGEQFRMEQGIEIGKLARMLFPDGLLIDTPDLSSAATATQHAIAAGRTVFEATFLADQCVAKADILCPHGEDWHVVEVKSSLEDTDQLGTLTDDLAYTVLVARQSGLKVAKASLLLISRKYRKEQPADRLFVEVDRTQAVRERFPDFLALWDELQKVTAIADPPAAMLNGNCRSCEFFDSDCLGRDIANPLHQLPRFPADGIESLAAQGVREISDIDDSVPLSELQARVRDAVRTGREFVAGSLREDLDGVQWPAYYLDFESVMTALPLYPDQAPYEQVPTQFSIHRCTALGQIDHHSEFLADHNRDCRRELAERLIAELGEEGSVVVYSSFELTRINDLADLFPDLKPKLESIAGRLFDLLPVIQRGHYHPEFFGSFSIKTVLPVLVPELSYDGLDISDGDAAVAQFARLAMNQIDGAEAGRVRQNLLEYCKLDTLAMVRLHERLWQRAESTHS